jgi:hypothetical protein
MPKRTRMTCGGRISPCCGARTRRGQPCGEARIANWSSPRFDQFVRLKSHISILDLRPPHSDLTLSIYIKRSGAPMMNMDAGIVWQESFTARLEALALLETLNAELLSHDSATLALDHWCAAHRLASPPHIVAERVNGADRAPTGEQRQLLGVKATEPIRYRKVRLTCGDHVLSEADNW